MGLTRSRIPQTLELTLKRGNKSGPYDMIIEDGQSIQTENSTVNDRIAIQFASTGFGADSLKVQRVLGKSTGQLSIDDTSASIGYRNGVPETTSFSVSDGIATLSKAGSTASLRFVNGNNGDIVAPVLSDNRTYTLPDKDGTFAMLSDIMSPTNIANTDGLTVDTAGLRKFHLGGDLGSDKFEFRNNSDTLIALGIAATGDVIVGKKVTINASVGATGGALDVHAGNSNDYVQEWFNSVGARIMHVRTSGDGSQLQMGDSSGAIQLTISGQSTDSLLFAEGRNIKFGTATGSKIGGASDKLALFGATPVGQPAHIADVSGTAVGTDAAIINDMKTKFNTLLAQHASLGLQAAS